MTQPWLLQQEDTGAWWKREVTEFVDAMGTRKRPALRLLGILRDGRPPDARVDLVAAGTTVAVEVEVAAKGKKAQQL